MAIKTQLRLGQVTGSLQSQRPTSLAAQSAMNDQTGQAAGDVNDIFKYYAKAIANVHGNLDVGAQAPGAFSQTLFSTVDNAASLGKAPSFTASGNLSMNSGDIAESTLNSNTTTISFSSTVGVGLSDGTVIAFKDGSNNRIYYKHVGSAAAGATSINVVFQRDVLDATLSMSQSSISVVETGTIGNNAFEWNSVRAPQIRSIDAMTVESFGINTGLSLLGQGQVKLRSFASSIDIDADAGSLSLDGSSGINIGTAADRAIDIDSSTLDIDASGAITIDSTSTIVLSGDGGATLSDDTEALAYDGSGNVDFDAVVLDIDATGELTIDSTAGVSVGSAEAALDAVQINASNSGGGIKLRANGADALSVSDAAVTSVKNVLVAADGKQVIVGSTVGAKLLVNHKDATGGVIGTPTRFVQEGAFDLHFSGSKGLKIAAGAGAVVLSGSNVSFAADQLFTFGGDSEGGVVVCDDDNDAVLYRAIPGIGTNTSILKAFSVLNTAITAGEPSLFRTVHAGSSAATVTLTAIAGDVSTFGQTALQNKLDVYVNGQLMMSGTDSQVNSSAVDYNIAGDRQLKFSFPIEAEDVVTAIDRS
jgi:hypothetical protein